MKTATTMLLILVLLTAGCGGKVPSNVTTALEAIIIAADVLPAAIPNLTPEATSCIAAIPGVVTTISDVIAGSQPLSTAQTAVGDLQGLLGTSCAIGAIPVQDRSIISGIVAAVRAFLAIYQQYVGGAPVAQLTSTGYQHGFFDSASTAAKYKASKTDKKKAAAIKARAAALKAKLKKK